MRRLTPLILVLLATAACSNEPGAAPSTTSVPVTTQAPGTTTAGAPADPRTPVVLDYSPTVSDIGALAFLAVHPEVRLVAVTLPGTGESYCEHGVAHTRGVLIELGLPHVPVACGPDDPITGWNAFPTSWRVGSNEMELPEGPPNETRSAPDLLADLIRDADTPVEIVAVGPLTNLALAFEADPGLADLVAGITIMGGAIDVPGNVFRNEVAEWNIWVDPTAAGIVFASGAPVTLVPLDATNHLPANTVFFDALDGAAGSTASSVVRDAIEANPFWLSGEGFYFWDELAAAVLVEPSLVEFETRSLVVDDDLRENKGWTREDPSGSAVRVAVSADRRAFEQLYLDTLVGAPTALPYVEATGRERAYFEALEEITRTTSAGFDEIFEQVAIDMGIDVESDEGWLTVLVAAIPQVFAGPWNDRIAVLETLTPPAGLEEAHRGWIAALRMLPEHQDEMVAALLADEFEAIDVLFEAIDASCRPIREAADFRLLEVAFDCF